MSFPLRIPARVFSNPHPLTPNLKPYTKRNQSKFNKTKQNFNPQRIPRAEDTRGADKIAKAKAAEKDRQRQQVTPSLSLKYEPASEPLHISVK